MSQGLIRLKKVKVAPKRTLSILKNNLYKKQLSVRFEDLKPLETIKTLSQDIDQISNIIDSYFPLISVQDSQMPPQNLRRDPSTLLKKPSKNSSISNEDSIESYQCSVCNSKLLKSSENPYGLRDNNEKRTPIKVPQRPDVIQSKSLQISDENGGTFEKALAASQAYGLDFVVVKRGRIYKPHSEAKKEIFHDNPSPKIIKQTKPPSRALNRSKKKISKDVIISTI